MQDVVNGRPAPKWAFNIAIMVIVALLSWFVSDRAAAAEIAAAEAEIANLESRVTAVEAIEPRLVRIEGKLDELDSYLRGPRRSGGRGAK